MTRPSTSGVAALFTWAVTATLCASVALNVPESDWKVIAEVAAITVAVCPGTIVAFPAEAVALRVKELPFESGNEKVTVKLSVALVATAAFAKLKVVELDVRVQPLGSFTVASARAAGNSSTTWTPLAEDVPEFLIDTVTSSLLLSSVL